MKIKVIVIGETDQKEFKSIELQYIEKIKRYTELEIKMLKDPGKGLKLSEEALRKKEAKLIKGELKPGDYLVLLDEKGKEYSSKAFAMDFLQRKIDSNLRNLVFVIGGPFGFDSEIKEISKESWSLSKLTFTHQMVRMIMYEQLYRGYSIMKGEKYHHE